MYAYYYYYYYSIRGWFQRSRFVFGKCPFLVLPWTSAVVTVFLGFLRGLGHDRFFPNPAQLFSPTIGALCKCEILTSIRPVLTYASATWTLSKIHERRLSLFERKVLRCIFGAKQENGTWRKRYNYELYETFNEPNIVTYIKVKRLAQAEHLVCVNNDRTIKKIFNTKPDGVRSVGGLKL